MTTSTYPETLFHFCGDEKKGEDALKSILSSKSFIPSYARERVISTKVETPYFFVPMVSFCDFKVHELNLHFTKYGKFGIGLSKTWGIEKGLNPVFYFSNGSELFPEMWSAIFKVYEIISISDPEIHYKTENLNADNIEALNKIKPDEMNAITRIIASEFPRLLKLLTYAKNYQGELKRDGEELIPDFRFADDREWRYVPKVPDRLVIPENLPNSLTGGKHYGKEELNEQIINSSHHLEFGYDDVKFIFVPDEDARLDLISFIETIEKETRETINLLISKITVISHLDL